MKIKYVQLESDAFLAAKERDGNVNDKRSEDTSNSNTGQQAHCSWSSVRNWQVQCMNFSESLVGIIKPKNRSDITRFGNVGKWFVAGCESGRFDGEIFARVLDLARQARRADNPAGLLMATLKQELDYGDQGRRQE